MNRTAIARAKLEEALELLREEYYELGEPSAQRDYNLLSLFVNKRTDLLQAISHIRETLHII